MAKVILIDDDVDLVEMYKAVLVHRGHEVSCAFNAAEGMELLKAGKPDLAVLDVMMETTTSGFHLARETHELYPELPLLMLTGVHEATGVSYRFEPDETWLPVAKFIDKPVAADTLADEIDALL